MLNNKYDPRLKSTDELEKTFACGEKILQELTESLQPGKNGKLSNQSWIITGSRGAGKSHLLVLLYRNIKKHKTLSRHWFPLIFPEELFDVESMYRLLLNIFENLFEQENGPGKLEKIENEFNQIKKIRLKGNLKEKKELKHQLTKKLFDLLVKVNSTTGRKIILMLENLQHIFNDQLPEDDLQHLRAFMHEHPGVFIIIGTALTVFDEIENYGKPFYHFFRIRLLENLDRQGIIDFLTRIALFRNDSGMDIKIEDNRHYIYTYTLLTAGNPRLILFLYELLLDNDHLDTDKILAKITELTPYFLDKTRDESSQRKLILHALATGPPAQTATEIGDYINAGQKSVTEQLKRLEDEGWIKELRITGKGVKQKEVFYTLRDYFYRVWYKVRMKGIDESDVYCMAELAAILFDRKGLEERSTIAGESPSAGEKRILYRKALELAKDSGFMKNIQLLIEESKKAEDKEMWNLLVDLVDFDRRGNFCKVAEIGKKLTIYPGAKALGYYMMGASYFQEGDYKEAYEYYSEAVRYTPGFKEVAFYDISELKTIASSIFNSAEELRRLLDKKSTLEAKMESLCRLLLQGKFAVVTEAFDLLLAEKELPGYETKKLEFFLRGYILDIVSERDKGKLSIHIKYWILLIRKICDDSNVKRMFLKFLWNCILSAPHIKDISLTIIEDLMEQFYEEGIEISGIIVKIIRAAKNPGTREAQQWMADPVFADIVEWLSI
jgi:DNA-binding MarR family transcriptional regulator